MGASQLLLDCGASSLIAMRRFTASIRRRRYGDPSHLPGDHFGGVRF
jgi:hypothetical protein